MKPISDQFDKTGLSVVCPTPTVEWSGSSECEPWRRLSLSDSLVRNMHDEQPPEVIF